MGGELTLDQALLKIVELEETIDNQNSTMENLKGEIAKSNEEKERLQKSNMQLYLKITNNKDDEEIEETEKNEKEVSKMNKLISEWGV